MRLYRDKTDGRSKRCSEYASVFSATLVIAFVVCLSHCGLTDAAHQFDEINRRESEVVLTKYEDLHHRQRESIVTIEFNATLFKTMNESRRKLFYVQLRRSIIDFLNKALNRSDDHSMKLTPSTTPATSSRTTSSTTSSRSTPTPTKSTISASTSKARTTPVLVPITIIVTLPFKKRRAIPEDDYEHRYRVRRRERRTNSSSSRRADYRFVESDISFVDVQPAVKDNVLRISLFFSKTDVQDPDTKLYDTMAFLCKDDGIRLEPVWANVLWIYPGLPEASPHSTNGVSSALFCYAVHLWLTLLLLAVT